MVVWGVVLVLIGAACVWGATRSRRKADVMLATDTLTIPELEQLRAASDEMGSRGQLRRYCEVVGTTHPAPVGPLTGPLSGQQCVWYARRTERQFRHYDRDDQGRSRVATRTERVSEEVSPHGWALAQGGLTIGVDHGGPGRTGPSRWPPGSSPPPSRR